MDWLKQSNAFVHLICTGGGAGAQQRLWSIPGASSYLSGASFPYSHAELEETLGFNPHSACSPEAAVDLASVAYQRASIGRGNRRAIGLGLTATASTLRTLKGGIRGHACALTDDGAIVTSLVISGSQSRREDGEAHDRLALETLRQAIEGGPIEDGLPSRGSSRDRSSLQTVRASRSSTRPGPGR